MTTASATDYITVYEIAKQRFGQRPSVQTVWRWVKKGVKGGIKLKAVSHGGTWHTTDEWFDEFVERQTEAAMQADEETSHVSDDDLEAAGIL